MEALSLAPFSVARVTRHVGVELFRPEGDVMLALEPGFDVVEELRGRVVVLLDKLDLQRPALRHRQAQLRRAGLAAIGRAVRGPFLHIEKWANAEDPGPMAHGLLDIFDQIRNLSYFSEVGVSRRECDIRAELREPSRGLPAWQLLLKAPNDGRPPIVLRICLISHSIGGCCAPSP